MIIDTNILIYLSKYLLDPQKILKENPSISIITKIEVLGFNFKNVEEHQLLLGICNDLNIIALTNEIADSAIEIRKKYRIKLPDAIIYATALVNNTSLITNDIDDFKLLNEGVSLVNPFLL